MKLKNKGNSLILSISDAVCNLHAYLETDLGAKLIMRMDNRSK